MSTPEIKEENTELVKADSNTVVDTLSKELVDKIVKSGDKEELEALYSQFNLNNTKKNAIRITELNRLLDSINTQAIKRFTEQPDTMTNKEILDYMNGVQNQIDRSQRIVEGINDINVVQVNNTKNTNNTVNIKVGSNDLNNLNRQSRDRVTSFISDILKHGFKDDPTILNKEINPEESNKDESTIIDAEIEGEKK